MRTSHLIWLSSLSLMAGLVQGADPDTKATKPQVEVVFVEPEKFTDLRVDYYASTEPSARAQQELREHLVRAGQSCLKPGQTLLVRITNVDLAGDFEPWRGPDFDHIRILRDIYPPAITLEFRLTGADGKVLAEGKRELRELGYLTSLALPNWDPLRYDKEMLRSWLRRECKDS
jgi:hypothetical protein